MLTRSAPPFSVFDSTATVSIAVLDVNDNTPVFNQTSYEFVVSEDAIVGVVIGGVAASDEDAGDNAAVEYSLGDGADVFAVDEQTGEVSVRGSLDRETVPSYSFSITANDRGMPSHSAQADITVVISDVNDNAPQFSQSSFFTQLVETTPIGTSILEISARDEDAGSNALITFSLLPPN